jgi:C1A family cysteine protease
MSTREPGDKIAVAQVQSALTQRGANWQAGVNFLTELPSQQRRLYLGFTPPGDLTLQALEDRGKGIAAGHQVGLVAPVYPSSFDWRNQGGQNYITPVKDQGACGSCVAFGTTAAVEGTLRVQRGNPGLAVDLSEASLFYCIAASQGRNCSTGWWPQDALTGYQNLGVPDESCFPYTAGNQACSQCADWASRATKITGSHPVASATDMKTWLSTRGPMSACLTVYDDFFSYTSGVYHHVTGNVAGGHCVCFAGYDDALGCWICKNSWGTGWGDSGYFRIAYGECGIEGMVHAVDGIVDSPPRPGCLPGIFRVPPRVG